MIPLQENYKNEKFLYEVFSGTVQIQSVQEVCFNVKWNENFIAQGNNTLNIVGLSARIKAVKPVPKHLLRFRDPDRISTWLQQTNFLTEVCNATLDSEAKSINNITSRGR